MADDELRLQTLLSECARRNQAAFEQLYELVSPRLFSLCQYMLRRTDLAEDMIQETFVQIWRDAGKFDPHRARAMTWMAVIARHRCLDLLRRRRPEEAVDEDLLSAQADSDPGPLELTLQWSDRYTLGHCLHQLNPRQRVCITMAFYRGFTHQQVSDHLSTPIGSVKSWIRRGLERLKRCLQE